MKKGLIFGLMAVGGGLLYLWAKGSSVANMVDKLTIKPKLNGRPSLKAGGGTFLDKVLNTVTGGTYLNVPIAVEFANRSDQEMTIGVTSVLAYYGKELVASNKPGEASVKVKANATTALEGINMQLPVTKLVSLIGTGVDALLSSGNFSSITDKLQIKITATLNNTFIFDITLALGKSGTVNSDTSPSVAGLGLVARDKRVIKPLSDYIAYIPDKSNLRYNDYVVKANGSVVDTANIMHQAATSSRNDVRQLALHLEGDSVKQTLQNIFDFIYSHIQYELDSRFTEQVRRPLRTLYDQKGDCDCFATLIGAMLETLGIPYKFRIAAYEAGRFQHVYVIVPHSNGYYVCDPVLDQCFAEKTPTKTLDI